MLLMAVILPVCSGSTAEEQAELISNYDQDNEALTFDNSAWNYDEDNDVYWQINVVYCSSPETTDYESMGIYVPGAYMDATENDDGTYTCTVNTDNEINGYTAETAPIVFPVNTAGYSAQAAPTSYSYSSISSYLEEGFVYVYAGMRGRDNGYDENDDLIYSGGAPWGVTDLKAAIRYYRFNQELLPGSTDLMFTFGHSGGGAQSCLTGATGDSVLYYDYLESIGAAIYDEDGNYISDVICGAMCWCPITSLDYANEAYEWNMGQYSSSGTRADDTWTSAMSDELAEAYASYINGLGLMDENGEVLTLEESEDGVYTSGTYYDYQLSVIEGSLNNFLSDTTFPYTESAGTTMADGGFGGSGAPSGEMPDGEMPSGDFPGETTSDSSIQSTDDTSDVVSASFFDSIINFLNSLFGNDDNAGTGEDSTTDDSTSEDSDDSTDSSSTTYETAQDYIDSLNSDETWIEYDEETNTVSVVSIEAFANHIKSPSKDVGAFDDLERAQAENKLFGNDESNALHFDTVMAALLEENEDTYAEYDDWDSSYIEEYQTDIQSVDKLGYSSEYRQNAYNPMYYICDYYDGYGSSTVATYWRIRTGIEQGDTASTVETNLALALEQYDAVEGVDFETVWGQGHTTAERTGDSTENFIEWVNECSEQ
ncbi:subtype A tannase [Methanolobus tindarius]|nr:subtype A tannase [Methanolobus tindarius]